MQPTVERLLTVGVEDVFLDVLGEMGRVLDHAGTILTGLQWLVKGCDPLRFGDVVVLDHLLEHVLLAILGSAKVIREGTGLLRQAGQK